MAEKRLRVRIGAFVLLTFVVLAVLLYMFGLHPNFFRKVEGTLFVVEFSDAPNVSVNTPVRRSGVKIGRVEEFVLDDDTGVVRVSMRMEPRYTLRRNEEPTLSTGLLSGDTTIDLIPRETKPGEPVDRGAVDPNDLVKGRVVAGVNTLLNRASAVAQPAQETLVRIQKSLERVEELVPKVEATLDEYRLLARDTRRAIPDVQRTTGEIEKLARDVRTLVPEVKKTNDGIQTLVKDIDSVIPDARKLMKAGADIAPDIQKLVRSANDVVPDIKAAVKSVNETVVETKKLVQSVNDTVPDVRKVLKSTDDAVGDARKVIQGVNDTVPEVRKLLKDVNGVVPEVEKLVKQASDTFPTVRKTLDEAALTAKTLRMVGERANVLLESNEDRIRGILMGAETAMKNLGETFNTENRNSVTTILRATKTKLPDVLDQAELLMRQGRGTLKKLDETFDSLNKGISPDGSDAKGIIKNLSEGLEKFNRSMGDINELMRVIGRSDGSLRRFISDPALFNHLDDAALMAGRVIPRMDRILKDLEVFADKLARHPEAIGLRGAVVPNSGLKEPPR